MSTINYVLDEQRIATITFNRDAKRNAFNHEMAEAFLRRLEEAEQEHARLVILRANPGVRIWCAGHDLGELDPESLDKANRLMQVFEKIQSTPLPVIAMVEGGVYAGGLIMLLCVDLAIAAENAEVAMTSNKMGIPLAPHLYKYWLSVMGIHKIKELLFTASTISAQDAHAAGLYNHVVPQEQLGQLTAEVANQILECDPEAVANSKHQLNLIATRSALTDEDRADLQNRNSQLLNSPELKRRMAALLASLGE